ncbi:hypothetical protein BB561_004334 [Smittium simulii]|uniref:Uncharacterized protein n=1 Tax=Smittium simulii TaxID=133385 RepID=A0A2T9YGV3_9FUNG|nr:hypothetical protein BB561_004334 [Smittium simulii]
MLANFSTLFRAAKIKDETTKMRYLYNAANRSTKEFLYDKNINNWVLAVRELQRQEQWIESMDNMNRKYVNENLTTENRFTKNQTSAKYDKYNYKTQQIT